MAFNSSVNPKNLAFLHSFAKIPAHERPAVLHSLISFQEKPQETILFGNFANLPASIPDMDPISHEVPFWDNLSADPDHRGILHPIDPNTGVPRPYGVTRIQQELRSDGELDDRLKRTRPPYLQQSKMRLYSEYLDFLRGEGARKFDDSSPFSQHSVDPVMKNDLATSMESFLMKRGRMRYLKESEDLWASTFCREVVQIHCLWAFLANHHFILTERQLTRYRTMYYNHKLIADLYGSLLILLEDRDKFRLFFTNNWGPNQYFFGSTDPFNAYFNDFFFTDHGIPLP